MEKMLQEMEIYYEKWNEGCIIREAQKRQERLLWPEKLSDPSDVIKKVFANCLF